MVPSPEEPEQINNVDVVLPTKDREKNWFVITSLLRFPLYCIERTSFYSLFLEFLSVISFSEFACQFCVDFGRKVWTTQFCVEEQCMWRLVDMNSFHSMNEMTTIRRRLESLSLLTMTVLHMIILPVEAPTEPDPPPCDDIFCKSTIVIRHDAFQVGILSCMMTTHLLQLVSSMCRIEFQTGGGLLESHYFCSLENWMYFCVSVVSHRPSILHFFGTDPIVMP